jgi:hypothetical protein
MNPAKCDRQKAESEIQENRATSANAPQYHEPEELPSREPLCQEAAYPRYEPGIHEAECVRAKVYRNPLLGCWKCQLDFQILPEAEPVCAFLHLGNGSQPRAGANSEYRRVWIIAAGQAPRKRQVLTSRVFKGKIFEVRIGDTTRRFDGRDHPEPAVYSTVKEIVRRTYP